MPVTFYSAPVVVSSSRSRGARGDRSDRPDPLLQGGQVRIEGGLTASSRCRMRGAEGATSVIRVAASASCSPGLWGTKKPIALTE